MEQSADTAFAIRASHMDVFLSRQREVERAQKFLRAFQPQLDPEKLGAVKPLKGGLFLLGDGGHEQCIVTKLRPASSVHFIAAQFMDEHAQCEKRRRLHAQHQRAE